MPSVVPLYPVSGNYYPYKVAIGSELLASGVPLGKGNSGKTAGGKNRAEEWRKLRRV